MLRLSLRPFLLSLVVFFFVLLLVSVDAERIESASFSPPFSEVDSGGSRMVNKHWRSSGAAMVSNNFVRLTPDRQSKKGALWSRKAIGSPVFSALLKFRISGQGKSFFGDGIGVWISNAAYYMEGDLHGTQEKFLGVGIIFDTFKNTETLAAHRDVTILINDGEKTWEMMTEDVKGCNVNVRYHNERADFSVTDASRAQIIVNDTNLQVLIDARNTGEWMECVNIENIHLSPGWATESYFGLTASTGQLADNHDVISLITDSDIAAMEVVAATVAPKKAFELDATLPIEERIKKIEDSVMLLVERFDKIDLHVEHELASVADKLSNLLHKLEKREEEAEKRIDSLEAVIKRDVEGTLQSRLGTIEAQLKGTVDRSMSNRETVLDKKLEVLEKSVKAAKDMSAKSAASAGSWRWPVFFLFVFFILACVGAYMFYRYMKKHHIL